MDSGEYFAIMERITQLEERQRFLSARILAIRYRRLLILRQLSMRATTEFERDNQNHNDDEIDSSADTESVSTDVTYMSLSDPESSDEESDCNIEMDCYCENCPQKAKLDK